MRSPAGDDSDSGQTGTSALPIGEESRGISTRSRGRLLAGEKTGPTEAAQSAGDSRSKRRREEGINVGKKREAQGGERMLTEEEVALEGVSVGKKRAAEGGERVLTAEEVSLEGVSVGKKRAAEGRERVLTAEETDLAARPLPPREIPYPKSGNHKEVVAWIHANDALYNNNDLGDEGDKLLCSTCY
jgi:hypothetical protein